MAVQILPETNLGQRLGSAIGTGLSSGLQGLLQSKLNDIERQKGIQQTGSGLESLGISPQVANLPQGLQDIVVKQLLQQPGQQSYATAISSLLGGDNQGQQQNSLQNLSGLNQQQTSELARLGLQKQKAAVQEKQFANKEARIEQHHIDKETKPYYDEILKAYKGARNTNPVLERMQTLLNNGKLPNPVFYGLANKAGSALGLNVLALQHADAQEFEKLTNEFLKNAKDIFGSRLTNYDVQTFLKSIPSLGQSDEGKQRIINNLKTVNEGALLKQRALKDIIAANGGKRPSNLNELVEEAVEPQLDQLAEMFAQGTPLNNKKQTQISNNTPSGQQGSNQSPQTIQNGIPLYGTQLSKSPEKQPSLLQEGSRHVARTGARFLEGLVGRNTALPALGIAGVNALSGGKIPYANEAQEILNPRNATKYLTGEALEPQSETEKKIDEVASDFGSFLGNPAQGILKMAGNAALKSGVGNFASYLAKSIGAGEGTQTGVKIATILGTTLLGGRKSLGKQVTRDYKIAEDLGKGQSVAAKSLADGVKKISTDVAKGIDTPSKTFLRPLLKKITDKVKYGKISVDEAVEIKKDLNELLRRDASPDKAKPILKKLVDLVKSGPISEFGKKSSEFARAFNKAENIYRGLNKTSKITDALKKHVNVDKIHNPIIKTLVLGGAYHLGGVPLAAGSLATAYGAREISKGVDLLKNSSEARKYYGSLLQAAAKGNADLINKYVSKLDSIADQKNK